MADHSKPVLTSTYANFVSELDARFDDLAVGLDPAVTSASNVPVNSIRWNSVLFKDQKWNGSSWEDKSTRYDININGTIGATVPNSASVTALTASGTVSGAGFTARFSTPGPIGNTTPSTGTFTDLNGSFVIPAINGGTGHSSYSVGDLIYASTTTTLGKLAGVATGNALLSGGAGAAPSYGKIGLSTHVSGVLSIANGGTGANATAAAPFAIKGAMVDITSINGSPLACLRNKIINGGFPINQRGVSGTVTLSSGQYGHDRWKAGADGCTYTFSTVNNVTTLTITSGSLQQVILGTNLDSGTYVLSWSGTAQGKIDAGTYATSGVTASVTGGTNTTVEFDTGTISKVQFELGAVPTVFGGHGPLELSLCQFYGEPCPDIDIGGYATAGASFSYRFNFQTPKRTAPTGAGIAFASVNLTACAATATSTTSVKITAVITGTGVFAFNNTSAPFFDCEL